MCLRHLKYDDKKLFFHIFNSINPDGLIAKAKHIVRSSHKMLISRQ